MILTFKLSWKVWSVDLIGRRVWLGLAVWKSKASGLGRCWAWKERATGRLFTTTWISGAYCFDIRRDDSEQGSNRD